MSIPDNRCGFVLTKEDTPHDYLSDRQIFHGPFYDYCCCRETWKNHDRCIWHTKEEGKPVEELVKHKLEQDKRFDGIYLVNVKARDSISFEDCSLHYSTFDGAYLTGINLRDVESYSASFHDCKMSYADLDNSVFFKTDFSESQLQIISAREVALTECDFSYVILDGAFTGADIWSANFSGIEAGSIDFRGARVINSDFSESLLNNLDYRFVAGGRNDFSNSLLHGDFSFSLLDSSEFSRSSIVDSTFCNANIENSDFTGTRISNSDFRGAGIYGCLLQNVQVDRSSKFGLHYVTSQRPIIDIGKIVELDSVWANEMRNWGGEGERRLAEKRIWALQTLQDIMQANSLFDRARTWYLHRKEAQREYMSLSGKWSNLGWWRSTASKFIMGYGEKPFRVILTSVLTIFMFAIGYTASGGIKSTEIPPPFGIKDGILVHPLVLGALRNLYFSSITFSTLGYGDLQPATWSVRILATGESFIGALLMALFVFVLGRITTW